jgi:hypothetical protein
MLPTTLYNKLINWIEMWILNIAKLEDHDDLTLNILLKRIVENKITKL